MKQENILIRMYINLMYREMLLCHEAPSHGLPAIIYDLKCSGSQAYIGLAKEFLERSSSNGHQ